MAEKASENSESEVGDCDQGGDLNRDLSFGVMKFKDVKKRQKELMGLMKAKKPK